MSIDRTGIHEQCSAYNNIVPRTGRSGDVVEVSVTGFVVKLSEVVESMSGGAAPTVTIVADTLVVDAETLPTGGGSVVARRLDVEPMGGRALVLAGPKRAPIDLQFIVGEIVGAGRHKSLKLTPTFSDARTPLEIRGFGDLRSATASFETDGVRQVTYSDDPAVLADALGSIWSMTTLNAQFAAAAWLAQFDDVERRQEAHRLLTWIMTVTQMVHANADAAPDTLLPGDLEDLRGHAMALLASVTVADAYRFTPSKTLATYEQGVEKFLTILDQYEQQLRMIGLTADVKGVQSALGTNFGKASLDEIQPLQELIADAGKQLRADLDSIAILERSLASYLWQIDSTIKLLSVHAKGEANVKLFVAGVQLAIGVYSLSSAFFDKKDVELRQINVKDPETAYAFLLERHKGKLTSDMVDAALKIKDQGFTIAKVVATPTPTAEASTQANGLAQARGKLLEHALIIMAEWLAMMADDGAQSRTLRDKIIAGPLGAGDIAVLWDDFATDANTELTMVKDKLDAGGEAAKAATNAMALVAKIANTGKAIDVKLSKTCEVVLDALRKRDRIAGIRKTSKRWGGLVKQTENDLAMKAALQAMIAGRADGLRQSLRLFHNYSRDAYFYLNFRLPGRPWRINTNAAQIREEFHRDSTFRDLGEGGGRSAVSQNNAQTLTVSLPIVFTDDTLPDDGSYALFSQAPAGQSSTLTWSLRRDMKFVIESDLPQAGKIPVWVRKASFVIDDLSGVPATPRRQLKSMRAMVSAVGVYENGFGDRPYGFLGGGVSKYYSYNPNTRAVTTEWIIDDGRIVAPPPYATWIMVFEPGSSLPARGAKLDIEMDVAFKITE